MNSLRLDWCSYDAALYACLNWHYAKAIPRTRILKIGVWENGVFVGAIIFSRGANNNMAKPYGLTQFQAVELVRIALRKHETPVTRLVSIAVKMLQKQSPGIRLIVSYADSEQGHVGSIYQAGNWIYAGRTTPAVEHIVKGRRMHGRAVRATYGTSKGFPQIMGSSKYRYLMPLDAEMKAKIEPLRKPYPKRAGSADNGTTGNQPEGDGVNPISALHS